MEQDLNIPDLSAWRLVPLLTLEQAALLWGGIDPAKLDFNQLHLAHEEKARMARIALQAFAGGIVLGTLSTHATYLFDNAGGIYLKNDNFPFLIGEIDIKNTLVMRDVIIKWAAKNNVKSLKMIAAERNGAAQAEAIKQPETVLQIEYRPYKPKYENHALEVAIEISQEIYDHTEAGGKPPKSLVTQDMIREKLIAKRGDKPTDNEVNRIDSIARPPCFKNQLSKKNG